ncbi:MAG: hypothetical protein JSU63_20990 [Phycisphaerales bacterium]|nr:MAG: hypothetical protein JSU63_20990 [Phycisphaerales bacterium]
MGVSNSQTVVLPALRPDVELIRGPDDCRGAPTYVIHDPLQGTFDKTTWVQAQILKLLSVPTSVERVLAQLIKYTTIRVSAKEVAAICADATAKGLTTDSCVADARQADGPLAHSRRVSVDTLLKRTLYMRLPLFRSDEFLARTVRIAGRLAHPAALSAYLLVSLVGIILLSQRLDAYWSTFPHFFNLYGAACFVGAVVVTKTIHELSHAYVAKAMGVRVPVMGVALILLFPVAYTDVTDSWRLQNRHKRLLISLAGVIAELIIAGIALLIWAVSPPGVVKSVCFVLSSTALLSTLLVNLNPAMRFDGYYVLSDLLGIDNLQSRSFTLARWAFRRHILALDVPSPEADAPLRRMFIMLVYAAFSWTYRLFLFSGIALMFYHLVTRAIGCLLFAVTLYSFIAKPLFLEIADLLKMKRASGRNWRMALVTLMFILATLWLALPMPRRCSLPGITIPVASQTIYMPDNGFLQELRITRGCVVAKGEELAAISSPVLESQAALAELEVKRAGLELAAVKANKEQRALLPQKTEELARATAGLASIEKAIQRNRTTAEIDGVVVDLDECITNGTAVSTNQVLGRILDRRPPEVVGYAKHDMVSEVSPGTPIFFVSHANAGRIRGTVTDVDPVRTTYLAHRALASIARGDIAVAPDYLGRLEVLDSYYRVEIGLEEVPETLRVGQTGTVWLRTSPRSRAADLVRRLYDVLVQESGL